MRKLNYSGAGTIFGPLIGACAAALSPVGIHRVDLVRAGGVLGETGLEGAQHLRDRLGHGQLAPLR